jgi:hypothetical protein
VNPNEKLLWSIAFPGFGQFLNGKYIKGILFVILEIIVNNGSNFNKIIMLSFHGEISQAIEQTNYQWLMFYPCIYFMAMWDAYKDAGGEKEKYSFFPFVFSAYSVTTGCIYSDKAEIFGALLGPVWFPILCIIPGVIIGNLVKICIIRFNK